MKLGLTELAPFLTLCEHEALMDEALTFDAISLYIRVFCLLDTEKDKPLTVSHRIMAVSNGMYLNNCLKPMRDARIRTTIRHLERVGLIAKVLPESVQKFKRVYICSLADGQTALTSFEAAKLVDINLSYEAVSLYVRAIRPYLSIHSFTALVYIDTLVSALTFNPINSSPEHSINGRVLLKATLQELINSGLIECEIDGLNYVFTCHVSKGFDSYWLKSLSKNTWFCSKSD